MIRVARHFNLMVLATLLAIIACGPATRQSASPAATQLPTPAHRLLLKVVDAFSAGNNELALALSDSLLKVVPPSANQLNFLAAYYGIKSRQALGQPTESVEEVLGRVGASVSDKQRGELKYLVHGPAESAPQAQSGGPLVAYKIGVILPLSGQYYEFGEAVLEGVKLAVAEYNKNTSGMKVELDVRDDAGEPVRAASLGRALASDLHCGRIGRQPRQRSHSVAGAGFCVAGYSAGMPHGRRAGSGCYRHHDPRPEP